MYSLAYLLGYEITIDDIKQFRRLGSKTPGHPELDLANGIECTTGPLGQGIGFAVGMALAERMMREKFGSALCDHYTYALAGDGCLMEGISYEAAALAAHWGLDRLIVLFDDNGITIDGPTSLATSEDQEARFRACGWDWIGCDGHDPDAIAAAIAKAKVTAKPTVVACKTTIGFGAPDQGGQERRARRAARRRGNRGRAQEHRMALPAVRSAGRHRQDVAQGRCPQRRRLQGVEEAAGRFQDEGRVQRLGRAQTAQGVGQGPARRQESPVRSPEGAADPCASKVCTEALMPIMPNLIGGSADLTPSNMSRADGTSVISKGHYTGQYIHFGVREHAMGAINVGMVLHKGVIPYCSTFFVFVDYMRTPVRLSALMEQPGALRLHPRLHHPGPGRADPPGGRALRHDARDAEYRGPAPGLRRRGRGVLGNRPEAEGSSDRPADDPRELQPVP